MGTIIKLKERRFLAPWVGISVVVFVRFMSCPIVSNAFESGYLGLVENIIIFIEAIYDFIVIIIVKLRIFAIIVAFHVIQCVFKVVSAFGLAGTLWRYYSQDIY